MNRPRAVYSSIVTHTYCKIMFNAYGTYINKNCTWLTLSEYSEFLYKIVEYNFLISNAFLTMIVLL